jgi:hypothetical protein
MTRDAVSFVSLILCLTGCGSDPDPDPTWPDAPVDDSGISAVNVWVQEHPDLLHNAASAGCDLWYAEGVRCDIVADPLKAQVLVYADDLGCPVNPDGTVTLATAYPNRVIVFQTKCLVRGADGRVDPAEFTTVMGHEVGHQIGIWGHVPETCAEPHLTHPTGGPLCGQALMNPNIESGIRFMTAQDHLAFTMRDRDVSILPDDSPAPAVTGPECTFRR